MTGNEPVRTVPPRVYGLIGVMVLFWAMNFVVVKIALREMQALELIAIRTTLAALLMLPIYFWWRGRLQTEPRPSESRFSSRWSKRDVPALIRLGIFGIAMNQMFFMYGLSRTTVSHSSLLIATTPLLVLIVAAVRGQERITRKKILGMTIAFAGVAALQLKSSATGGSLEGDALIMMGAILFAIFTVLGKEVAVRHGSIMVNTFAYVGGALCFAPVMVWHGLKHTFDGLSATTWASVLFMAIFPSVVCYLIYYYALSHISASRVSAFAYLQPLLATMMALPALGERLSGALVLGGLLVLTGVWLTERA